MSNSGAILLTLVLNLTLITLGLNIQPWVELDSGATLTTLGLHFVQYCGYTLNPGIKLDSRAISSTLVPNFQPWG